MKHNARYVEIAERIYSDAAQQHASSTSYVRVKPLRELTKEYQASFGTISRAIRHLVEDGRCVKKGPRAFFFVWDKSVVPAQALIEGKNAESVFAERIRNEILSGRYETGTQLPKIQYFALTYSVSSHTVSSALKLLREEGLVYKHGKKWLVGNPVVEEQNRLTHNVQNSYRTDKPVVVAIVPNPNQYVAFGTHRIYQSFIDTLLQELSLNGHEVTVCFTEDINPQCGCVFGAENIVAYARDLQRRYAGTLILRSPKQFSPQFLEQVAKLGKPVLWFDVDRHSLESTYAPLCSFRNFIPCRINEQAAVESALRFLLDCGHRRIGVPDPLPTAPDSWRQRWIRRRVSTIASVARRFAPRLELFTTRQTERLFLHNAGAEMFTNLWRPAGSKLASEELLHPGGGATLPDAPSLHYLVRECKVSAILACNDLFARDYFFWFGRAGIVVPDDISLVSFDNSCTAVPLGLTSVDFGVSHLAHQVTNLIMNRIAPPVGKPPTLWSRPWLIRRRSVRV
jgi:DNA-binding LacI/PurR family transcriptional regulator